MLGTTDAEPRISLIANDILAHFEQRTEALVDKAMILCMSRRICISPYRALAKLRPNRHHEDITMP